MHHKFHTYSYISNYIFFIAIFLSINVYAANQGVCIVSCADLISEPMNNAQQYDTIPISVKKFDPICPRIYQLLFNEIIDIIEYKEDQVFISVPHFFYQQANQSHKNTRFWTKRNSIISLTDIQKKGVSTSLFPVPLSFKANSPLPSSYQDTISLTQPFVDRLSGITFSAGTRFKIASSDQYYISVYVYDIQQSKHVIKKIPKKICAEYNDFSQKRCIQRFISLLKSWAHPAHGFIPYVLGGASFCNLCTHPFEETPTPHNIIYTRKEMNKLPYTGLDCAGLIIRVAQIAGIPFYYKNTITIAGNLKALKPTDTLHEGDIIWIPGHVMVVSSLEKGLLIEARSYEHGYGKVHEIPLSEEFKDITTYNDLLNAYYNKTPLQRLDKSGTIKQIITDLQLLKLESAWLA